MPIGTRLYVSNEDVSPLNSLAFDAAWNSNNARRVRLYHHKRSDEITLTTAAYTAGHNFCFVQAVSSPLTAGQAFTTSWTVKSYFQAAEALAEDNVDRILLGIRVVNGAGSTQATLLAVGSYANTAEFNLSTGRAKAVADGDALTSNYTTVTGDRLAIELGFTDTTGTTPTAGLALGMAEEDCPENETETNERAGWIEFTNNVITFEAEGPTRFWFPTTEAAAVSPAFHGDWEDNNEAVRRRLRHVKDLADTLAAGTAIVWTAGQDGLDRQFVSDPMVAGQVFDTTVTCQGMWRALESATNDNVNQIKFGLRVFSNDGSTERAVLVAVGNHSGLSPSELGTTTQARRLANAKALGTSYTTVDGDRLVLEVGYTDDGAGASIAATGTFGMSDGDAPYAFNGSTSSCSPWFELSIPLKFKPGSTRFYFPNAEPAEVEATPDADWEYTTDKRNRRLRYFKEESNVAAGQTVGAWTLNQDALDRQCMSDPMIGGILFSTSITVKMQMMTREAATTDDVGIAKLGIRIVSLDGQTVRATLLAVGNYSPTSTEWPTTFQNKTYANGDALTGTYVTAWGDRICVEYGFQDLGTGATPQASSSPGCEAADLPENESATTGAGWIEFNGVDVYFVGIHTELLSLAANFPQSPGPARRQVKALAY